LLSNRCYLHGGVSGKEWPLCLAPPSASFIVGRNLDPSDDLVRHTNSFTRLKLKIAFVSQVGFDSSGVFKALDVTLYNNGGNTNSTTEDVMNRALFHITNAYKVPPKNRTKVSEKGVTIHGKTLEMYNGGNTNSTTDVMKPALFHITNAYKVPTTTGINHFRKGCHDAWGDTGTVQWRCHHRGRMHRALLHIINADKVPPPPPRESFP
jgi:hypothetical protein